METELSPTCENERFTQTMATTEVCKQCLVLQEKNRLLRNQLIDEKQKLAKEKSIVIDLRSSKWFIV